MNMAGHALISRTVRFLYAPGTPVLPPYRLQRSPLDAAVKKMIPVGIAVLLGIIYGFLYALLPPAFLTFLMIPLVVLIMIVIWLLPERDTAPTAAIHWLFFAFWMGMILWPNYLAIALPGLPWISVRRLFGGPLLLLLLISVSTSAKFRSDLTASLQSVPLLWKLMAAFVIVQLLSLAFADSKATGFARALSMQMVWTSIFFVSAYVFLTPGRIVRWAWIMCGMAVVVSLIALLEAQQGHVLWVDHIPSFLKVEDESVAMTLAGKYRLGQTYRSVSTFATTLALAEFLALTCPFLIHIAMIKRKPAFWVLFVAVDILIIAGILASQSRLGMVGFVVGHAAYGLLWAVRKWRTDRVSLFGPALTLAYPALMAVTAAAILAFGRLRTVTIGNGQHAPSNMAREMQVEMAGPVFLKSPLFGHGPNQGASALGYTNPSGTLTIDSYILSILLDYGIVGFLVYYGMILVGIRKAVSLSARAKDDELGYALPVAVALMVFVVSKLVLSQEENHPIMFMLLGMVLALSYRTSREARTSAD